VRRVFAPTERTEFGDTMKLVRHCRQTAAVPIAGREIATNHLELQPKSFNTLPASRQCLVLCMYVSQLDLEKVQSSNPDKWIGSLVSYQPTLYLPHAELR
jgi:hypothetical protein